MELQEFITETLIQIVNGVKAAQNLVKDSTAIIAPHGYLGGVQYRREMQSIEFDVAITTTDTTEAKAGAGVFVAGISLGGQARGEASNQTLSRIKFKVPIYLPEP